MAADRIDGDAFRIGDVFADSEVGNDGEGIGRRIEAESQDALLFGSGDDEQIARCRIDGDSLGIGIAVIVAGQRRGERPAE